MLSPDTIGVGFALMLMLSLAVPVQPATEVWITLTVPVPADPHVTVMLFVPAPAVIVPPDTVHAYVFPPTAGTLYVLPAVPAQTVVADGVMTGTGLALIVTLNVVLVAEHVVAVTVCVTDNVPVPGVLSQSTVTVLLVELPTIVPPLTDHE